MISASKTSWSFNKMGTGIGQVEVVVRKFSGREANGTRDITKYSLFSFITSELILFCPRCPLPTYEVIQSIGRLRLEAAASSDLLGLQKVPYTKAATIGHQFAVRITTRISTVRRKMQHVMQSPIRSYGRYRMDATRE
jgi:hypothetical protein